MAKITLTGWMHARPVEKYTPSVDCVNGMMYHFYPYENMKASGYVMVCPLTIEFDTPEDYNPTTIAVQSLKDKITKLQSDTQTLLTDYQRQINELLAIEA